MPQQTIVNRRAWVVSALDQYEERLTRYALRLAGNAEAAQEAVQHAFFRLCDQSPDKLQGHLAAWLYTVCRNNVFDQTRRAGRTCSLDESVARVAGHERDPADCAETADLAEWARVLLHGLPASQREVVDLWVDGFSYSEISEITGRTANHVRVLAHRAFQQMRRHPEVTALAASDRVPGDVCRKS